ncbi:MAG: FAD-dependent oxidoreductase [Propioniciclava sp.]
MTPTTKRTTTITYQAQVRTGVDVVVVGAGPAGIAAALAAARQGARTLLVERYGHVGGNLTAGLVGPCMTSFSLDGSTQLIQGIFDELVTALEQRGQAIHPSKVPAGSPYAGYISYGHDRVTPFEPEAMRLLATEKLAAAGVELLLHSTYLSPLMADGAVTGVVVANKSGIQSVAATVTLDCTADGDVAASAGAAVRQGRDGDRLTQPMTLFFRVGGVDDAAVDDYVGRHPEDRRPFAGIVERARTAGTFTIPRRGIGLYRTLHRGVWRINTTRIQDVDGTDVDDLTRAEVEGQRQVSELMDFFRAHLPGFGAAVLVDIAATIGVRETRRIVGDYTLTLADLQSGRRFDDVIGLCGYPVDLHSPTDAGGGVREDLRTANAYQIPFRCLVPRDIDGLLVAGRCVSATHEALGAIRVMPPAFAMGEAAGVAAATAVRARIRPRDIDITDLQGRLRAAGAYLGEEH